MLFLIIYLNALVLNCPYFFAYIFFYKRFKLFNYVTYFVNFYNFFDPVFYKKGIFSVALKSKAVIKLIITELT